MKIPKNLLSGHHGPNRFQSFQVKSNSDLPLIIETKNAPIHLYATEVEEKAMKQVYALANSDIPVGPVAIMLATSEERHKRVPARMPRIWREWTQ